jgi:hypothetical protein
VPPQLGPASCPASTTPPEEEPEDDPEPDPELDPDDDPDPEDAPEELPDELTPDPEPEGLPLLDGVSEQVYPSHDSPLPPPFEPHPAQATAPTTQSAIASTLVRRARRSRPGRCSAPAGVAYAALAEPAEPAVFRLVIVASEFISNGPEIHAACHPILDRVCPSI